MHFFKKNKAWLIGGLVGLIYFFIIWFFDVGTCLMSSSNCTEITSFPTIIFNGLAVVILNLLYPINPIWHMYGMGVDFTLIAIVDFIFGSIIGLLIGKLVGFIKNRSKNV